MDENKTTEIRDELYPAFLAEVRRLGGTKGGTLRWLEEAIKIGLDAGDTAESLAWLCVDDELSNLDEANARAALLRANLAAARHVGG